MATKSNKKNPIARDLFSKKYKPKIVKPRKGKGSFKRLKKFNSFYIDVETNNYSVLIRLIFSNLMW